MSPSDTGGPHAVDALPAFDDRMLAFDDLPYEYPLLPEGHPLRSRIPDWASECLRLYNTTTSAARLATAPSRRLRRTATTTTTTRKTTTTTKHHTLRSSRRRHTLLTQPHRHNHHHDHHNTTPCPRPSSPLFFACPFYKHDPAAHAACTWTVGGLRSVYAAKQHVIAHHPAPARCVVCEARFPTAAERDAHRRARTCAPRQTAEGKRDRRREGVTDAQVDVLLRRDGGCRGAEGEGEESWFRMWDVLFPGEARPETGYLVERDEREVVALRAFWRRVGRAVVRGLLGRDGGGEGAETREVVAGSVLGEMVTQAGFGRDTSRSRERINGTGRGK